MELTPEEKKQFNALNAKRQVQRRQEKDSVQIEIPRAYRDWFKDYAARDGTTMAVAINGALEIFMEEEDSRGKI
jgi:hypothetical protein